MNRVLLPSPDAIAVTGYEMFKKYSPTLKWIYAKAFYLDKKNSGKTGSFHAIFVLMKP